MWIRTERQIDFLGRIWESLDAELQVHQSELLDELVSKLGAARKKIGRVVQTTDDEEGAFKVNRLKYATIKGSIDKAIDQLREWQRDFDPGWFLTLKIAKPIIDRELEDESHASSATSKLDGESEVDTLLTARNVRKHLNNDVEEKFDVFRKSDNTAQQHPIRYSGAKWMQRAGKGGSKSYIIDTVPCMQSISVDTLTKDVRELARKLSVTDPGTFGLLQCRGVVKQYGTEGRKPVAFDFIFQIPSGLHSPRSLRSILLQPDSHASLSRRFHLARQLARSISYMHTYNFVHKSIRPDTVLVLQNAETDLAASFLLGFEKIRLADGRTLQSGDSIWEKNLYRHPQRQGLFPEGVYVIQHDIYSLGVCLLEIGIWKSFVGFGVTEEATPTEWLPSDIKWGDYKNAMRAKESLVELAEKELPSKMGDKYTDVVVNCLTCLDEDNADFGQNPEDFEDEDGVQIGVRYIEKVKRQFQSFYR